MKRMCKPRLLLFPLLVALLVCAAACVPVDDVAEDARIALADATAPIHQGVGREDDTTWAILSDGTLVIDGISNVQNPMFDYGLYGVSPAWAAYADEVTQLCLGTNVRHVSSRAFASMYAILRVDLGNVMQVDDGAFADCVNLRRVETPTSLTELGNDVFRGCCRLREVVLTNVTSIGENALGSCPALVSVKAPDTLDLTDALTGSEQVRAGEIVTDENGLLLDGTIVVGYDARATELTIPSTVTEIAPYAFYANTQLTRVSISDGVRTIGAHAFEKCSAITSLTVGAAVTRIGESAFSGCTALDTLNFRATACRSYPTGGGVFAALPALRNVMIGSDVLYLQDGMFADCTALETASLPGSIVNIPVRLFEGCTLLSDVTLGEGIRGIRDGAFADCISLRDVTIPASLTTLYTDAFRGSGLVRISLPSVSSIRNGAFAGCSCLVSVELGTQGLLSIADGAFSGCRKLIDVVNHSTKSLTAGNSNNGQIAYYTTFAPATTGSSRIVEQNGYLFFTDPDNARNVYLVGYVGTETDLTFPTSFGGKAYTIYRNAFRGERAITSVKLSSGVRAIGDDAFREATALRTLDASDAPLTSIGDGAFTDCAALSSFRYPTATTLKTIGARAFLRCTSIGTVTIPASVTSIGEAAFAESGVTAMTVGGSTTVIPPSFASGCTSLSALTLRAGVEQLGEAAFADCTHLADVTLCNGLTTLGAYAFRGDLRLLTVSLPDTLTAIGAYAFEECSRLVSLSIGRDLASVGAYAFRGCDRLIEIVDRGNTHLSLTTGSAAYGSLALRATDIVSASAVTTDGDCVWMQEGTTHRLLGYIGSAMTLTLPADRNGSAYEIAPYAFYGTTVRQLTLGRGTTVIGAYAFADSQLTDVTLNASLRAIGHHAFAGSAVRRVLFTGYACKQIGAGAFRDCRSLVSLEIKGKSVSLGFACFTNCSALREVTFTAESKTADDALASVGAFCFSGATSLTHLTFPKSVKTFGKYWYADCPALIEIVNPSNASMGQINSTNSNVINQTTASKISNKDGYLFFNDQILIGYVGDETELTLPHISSGYKIGAYAFQGLTGIRSITFDDSVTAIGDYAFAGCTGLESICIAGASLGSDGVGAYLFYDCSDTLSISVDYASPEALAAVGTWSPVWNCREANRGHEYRVTNPRWATANAGQIYALPYLVNYGVRP